MSQVWFIPGVGNITTVDNPTGLPPGAYRVDTAVAKTVTSSPTTTTSQAKATAAVVSAEEKRNQEIGRFTGWDNNPAVRKLQEEVANIYIRTGSYNTPEQIELHRRAEEIRRAENPMYPGSTMGPRNEYEAARISLPTDQFQSANALESAIGSLTSPQGASNVMGFGILAIMVVIAMSFVKS